MKQQFLGGLLVKTVLPIAVKAVIEKATDRGTAVKIETAIKSDPAALNDLNGEAWYRSRVGIGSLVAAVSVVLPPLANMAGWGVTSSEIAEFGQALITLGGAVYALYGRFWPGLKPIGA